ncbi:MAG: TetR/AcrR family transcriptional regulator [Bacteroidota bacterium]
MAEKRRRLSAEERIEMILDASERMLLSGPDGAAASMSQLAKEAGLSKGLLYHYFKDKADIYNALSQRGLRRLRLLIEGRLSDGQTGLEQLEQIGRTYVEFFETHPSDFDAIAHFEAFVPAANEDEAYAEAAEGEAAGVFAFVASALEKGQTDGTVRPGLDPVRTAIVAWSQLHGVLHTVRLKRAFLHATYGLGLRELTEPAIEMILRSVRAV